MDDSKAPADSASGLSPSVIVTSNSTGLKRKLPSSSAAAASKKAHPAPAAAFALFETLPASHPHVDTFRSALLSHFFPDGRSPPPRSAELSLPGPQPCSLTRGDLGQLERGEYWVCEKSDGERAILLIHHRTRKVVLVDRKWTCRVMEPECGDLLVHWFAGDGDTVVDAELLEVELGKEDGRAGGGEERERLGVLYRVSMFDVLCCNGVRVAERMFGGRWNAANASDGSGRMDVIIKNIQEPYRERISKTRAQYAADVQQRPADSPPLPRPSALVLDAHLDFFVKTFVAKHSVESILRCITHSPSSNPHFQSHVYRTSRGTNLNDGLIFTPDCDSYYCRTTPLLKWKWPDLNTVDFVVEAPFAVTEKGLPLLCAGHVRNERGASGAVHVANVLFDHVRALDDIGRGLLEEVKRRGVDSAVVECGYSRLDSDWHLKCVRWDKAKSNFLSTVVATVKAVMDDLQSADVVAACKKKKFTWRRG